MSLWKRANDSQDWLKKDVMKALINEPFMLEHVKVEDYLTVALKLRPSSFFTIPAELPKGQQMGAKIDELCAKEYQAVIHASQKEKFSAINKLREKIQNLFETIVVRSTEYQAHQNWSKKLHIRTLKAKVRPSVHEIYLFLDPKIEKKLKKLMELRSLEIKKSLASVSNIQNLGLIYAEPSSEFVMLLGELLGYPICCINKYVRERFRERKSPEIRASQQLKAQGKGKIRNFHAYFTRNFFPCESFCVNATNMGKHIHNLMNEINPRLGDVYFSCLKANATTVEQYPLLMKQFREKLENKTLKMG
ncbi:MAG: DUF483 domain-containing protein [Candidatus Bathyarchaeota archaeon]|nr:MAG: DUF483 domain-containing protein [Candidatus Bathyarchaeota archaeon]